MADDHAIVRRGLNQILRDEFSKATITEVGDANEALDIISEQKFDLVICDISMPGTTGLDLFKRIKEIRYYRYLSRRFTIYKRRY